MKIKLILLLLLIFLNCFNLDYVYAKENSTNSDEIISQIINGINEEDFKDILTTINDFLGENKTFKEILVTFFKGELNINIQPVKRVFLNLFKGVFYDVVKILSVLIFLIVSQYISNIIISKNRLNNEKYTIFYI